MWITTYLLARYLRFNKTQYERFRGSTYELVGKSMMDKKAYGRMTLSTFRYDIEDALERIEHPMLFLYGEHDELLNKEQASASIEAFGKDFKLESIKDARHVAHLKQPEKVAEEINRLLKGMR